METTEIESGICTEHTTAANYSSSNLDTESNEWYCYDKDSYYYYTPGNKFAAAFTRNNRLYWIEENKNQFYLNSLDMDDVRENEREELRAENMPTRDTWNTTVDVFVSCVFGDKVYFVKIGLCPRVLCLDFSSKTISDLTRNICGLDGLCDIKYA